MKSIFLTISFFICCYLNLPAQNEMAGLEGNKMARIDSLTNHAVKLFIDSANDTRSALHKQVFIMYDPKNQKNYDPNSDYNIPKHLFAIDFTSSFINYLSSYNNNKPNADSVWNYEIETLNLIISIPGPAEFYHEDYKSDRVFFFVTLKKQYSGKKQVI